MRMTRVKRGSGRIPALSSNAMAYMQNVQNRVPHPPQQVTVPPAHSSGGAGGPPIVRGFCRQGHLELRCSSQHECFLRLNHEFPLSPNYSHDMAVKTLLRLPQVSHTVAYSFVHIDKPSGKSSLLSYLLFGHMMDNIAVFLATRR